MNDCEVLGFLAPKKYDHGDFKRLGRNQDGGYVVPISYCKSAKALISFGVGDDISFERDFLKENDFVEIDIYDGTVSSLPEKIKCNFHRQNCYFEKMNPFSGMLSPGVCKMDIEGEEYNLPNLPKEALGGIECLVIEVHFLNDNKEKARALFSYLSDCGMSVVHIHGNNNCLYQDTFGVRMPQTLELTLIKRKIEEKSNVYVPISGLDFPCNPSKKELRVFC